MPVAVMAVEPAAAAAVAPRRQYSMADVLQLRSGAACNVSLEEAGIVIEPATQIIFKSASQSHAPGVGGQFVSKRGDREAAARRQRAPAGSPVQQHHPHPHSLRSGGEASALHYQSQGATRQGKPGAAVGHPAAVPMGAGGWGQEEEEWGDAEEDSEDETPQYKAFHVSGQPDFSIQEPDAAEYLRRVRWASTHPAHTKELTLRVILDASCSA